MPRNKNRRRRIKNRSSYQKLSMTTPISQPVQTRVIDTLVGFSDSANSFLNITNVLLGSTDYGDLASSYGEIKWVSYELMFVPYFIYSTTMSDYAQGQLGYTQGTFAPVNLSAANVAVIPYSFPVSNRLSFRTPLIPIRCDWIPTTMTNTITSPVPKLTVYFGWTNLATTNTNYQVILVRVKVFCKSQLF